MGRTFKSVRMGSQEVAQRWLKASRALNKDDQIYGRRLAEMIKKHSSEAFYAIDDPLEAAIFSVLIELLKEIDRRKVEKEDDVDL
jgi:dihydroxyacetone kinase-like predicted kinase